MEKYYLEGSDRTPEIRIDSASGTIEIRGRSMPENTDQFFRTFQEKLIGFVQNPAPKILVTLDLDYFNTATSKTIVDLIESLSELHRKGHAVTLEFFYEEDDWDMKDTGDDLVRLYGTMIKPIAKEVQ